MATVQAPVPVQPSPLHPSKVDPAAGSAVRVTGVPRAKGAVQALPQSMPTGLDVTAPEPLPVFVTDSARCSSAKAALIEVSPFTVKVQGLVVQPAPVKPAKSEPVSSVAVTVICVPAGTVVSHVVWPARTPVSNCVPTGPKPDPPPPPPLS
jgi:DMSO/TMAO reductase YedYZ molybdopterin-dependent catalytic subunit